LIDANLSNAQLHDANLSSVRLDHAEVSRASLRGATLLTTADDADFRGADLSQTSGYLIASEADLRDARIRHAHLAPEMSNQPMGMLHTVLAHANLARADVSFSDLSFADVSYASFRGAILKAVNFRGADLSGADFTGADVTGANFSQADLAGAVFARILGRSAMKGLRTSRNLEQAVFRR
jgi:uncharacterized protein YjbI with pentapeptide repeats